MASMLSPILSVWISTERRRLVQVVPDSVRKVWDNWDLRILVLISFVCHYFLLATGKSRKNRIESEKPVWASYLISDWVLNVSLGIISSKVADQVGQFGDDANNQVLVAFWSTLLFVHIGGPPTITAEALEDNALWPRTFVFWIFQTCRVLYIVLVAWRSEYWLPYVSIGMLLVGFIKCGERTWAQYYASFIDNGDDIKSMKENCLMEGSNKSNLMGNNELVTPLEKDNPQDLFQVFKSLIARINGCVLERFNLKRNIESPTEADIQRDPRDFFENFRLFFVSLFKDFVLSSDDLLREQSYFRDLGHERAFQYVDDQLGYAYDVLYTKAYVMFSTLGRYLCVCTTSIVIAVFICFCIAQETEMQGISVSDRVITLFSVGGILVQELFTMEAQLLTSNWNKFLRRHSRAPRSRDDNAFDENWLAIIRKCNLLTFCPMNTDSWTYKHCQLFLESTDCKVDENLKENIFEYLSIKSNSAFGLLGKNGMNFTIEASGLRSIEWIKLLEFHQSILTWHIATDLCYHGIDDVQGLNGTVKSKVDISKNLSEYMLYLLAMQRHILPIGRGLIIFPITCKETSEFFRNSEVQSDNLREACGKLLQFDFDSNRGSRGLYSNSALFDACRLARSLINEMETVQRWEFLEAVWIEILGYAATQCRAEEHAQQLKRGGEFLSHVWLLMAHLGLMEQFQVNTGTPTDSEEKSIDEINELVEGNTGERVQKQEDRIGEGEIDEVP